jgi:hypothetical protein
MDEIAWLNLLQIHAVSVERKPGRTSRRDYLAEPVSTFKIGVLGEILVGKWLISRTKV